MSQLVELACRDADRGRFDRAADLIGQLPPDRLEYAACRSLLASIYRQTGEHATAEAIDEQGLAAPVPDELGASMCSLGLVADRIGAGDEAGAAAALDRADDLLAVVPAWHWATRWFDPWLLRGWVAAELALLAGRPLDAVAELLPFADSPSPRVPMTRRGHERAKTLLFLGVARRVAGQPEEAVQALTSAARIARAESLLPLLAPIAEQLADLEPAGSTWSELAVEARAQLAVHPPPPPQAS